ncbi:MAG: alpha/beta hydrolase [Acidimicrobiales bacterium]
MTWPITDFSLTCDRSGVEHHISVALPARHKALDRMPLVLCLDGPWVFGTTLDATRIMSMSGEAPEAMVVGLSFSDQAMSEYLRQRARWFTPTPWVPPEITGVKGVAAEECGQAQVLLEFISEQLLAAVEERFCRDSGLEISERWLVGHSFSGLFGLRTLLSAPTLFDKWLLASPSIWWDDRAILGFESKYAAANDDLPARVFTCYGGDEAAPEVDTNFNMGANIEELVASLQARNYPSLKLTHQVLPGDGHASSIGAAISKGLRALV